MAFYCDYIFPMLNGRADPSVVSRARATLLARASGDVLEIGFGTGKSLPHYSRKVDSLTIVEPAKGMNHKTRKKLAQAEFPVHINELGAERLPFDDQRFDYAVTTKTLCSVDNVQTVLSELLRVLKPNGKLLVLEHVLSKDPSIQRWQQRLNPLQRRIGCGCHLTRDIVSALDNVGFEFAQIDYLQGGAGQDGTRFMPIVSGEATLPMN